MCVFNSPKPPAVAPAVLPKEAPKQIDTAVQTAAADERRRAAGARGANATLLADPMGLAPANTKKTTLLGGAATQLG